MSNIGQLHSRTRNRDRPSSNDPCKKSINVHQQEPESETVVIANHNKHPDGFGHKFTMFSSTTNEVIIINTCYLIPPKKKTFSQGTEMQHLATRIEKANLPQGDSGKEILETNGLETECRLRFL